MNTQTKLLYKRILRPLNRQIYNPPREEFWALRHISFEVKQGDRVGIIGRNGAGKSTLLKILSRITEPTKGRIKIKGRVASLLEVGTGFHPELTGRENIFLNGAILGMSKVEIQRKFDEIVAFAEVEKFLDTPVKRYSSGMYVRLAFAVAAHLEPEILIVDEVLAVGDTAFQNKCLGKMKDIGKGGQTILFVSHNIAAISELCSKALVLKNGAVEFPIGDVDAAIRQYLMQVHQVTKIRLSDRQDRQGEGKIRVTHFVVCDQNGYETELLVSGQYVEFRIYYQLQNNKKLEDISATIAIYSHTGLFITDLCNDLNMGLFNLSDSEGFLSCIVDKLPLTPGNYRLNLTIFQRNILQDWIREAVTIRVEFGDFYGQGKMPQSREGSVFFEQTWSHHSRLFAQDK